MQEIYKDLSLKKNKEFEKLLNNTFSNTEVEEGKIVEGTVTKITDKLIFLDCGSKSEGTLDINELKLLKEDKQIDIGSKISVLVERLEDKNGDLIISREKAEKLKSWKALEKAYENKEVVSGKILNRIKGGFVCQIKSSMCFLPGSQVDLKPLKNNEIDHLMKEPQRFLIVKCDKFRGNIVVSRRAILETVRNANKDEILSKYKVNDIVEGTVKGITAYGVFFDLDGFDCMCHINEVSWSRVGHPDEIFTIGQKQKMKIINIDTESKKISTSVKMLIPDPFETKINNYKVGQIYPAEVKKFTDYGIFLSLEDGLEGLCHQSELSHTKKNVSVKNFFSISQKIKVMIMEINLEKKRISLSYKNTQVNPWKEFADKFPVKSKIEGNIKNIADFGLFVKIKNFELDGMIHYKDISYDETTEDLKKFNKNDLVTAQVLEIDCPKEKIRLGIKQLLSDPWDYFKDKNKKDIITVIVKEILDTGIKVFPTNCALAFLIKKNQIAVDKGDQRTNRFTKGDKLDCMIQDIDLNKRKATLSIKMLEDQRNKEAIKKYGSIDSGKSLPFAHLTKALKQKKIDKEKN